MYGFTYVRLGILLFLQEDYQRSHRNGLFLKVLIQLFPTVNITFVAGILLEIAWELTESPCIDSLFPDRKYQVSLKILSEIIREANEC
jgi:hypothetical protein